jgi:hypothetical protein
MIIAEAINEKRMNPPTVTAEINLLRLNSAIA